MAPTLLLLTLALTPADAPAPPDGPPPPATVRVEDAGELQGEWEIISCSFGREDCTNRFRKHRWVFAGASARLVVPTDGEHEAQAIWVNPTVEPSHVDIDALDGTRRPGIYRRTGDELLWAKGEARPSSFEPAPGVWLWALRRVKK